jgi:hypothetical protein
LGIGWTLARYMNVVGLSHIRALDSDVGDRPRVYFRKSRRAGTRRHGGERREAASPPRILLESARFEAMIFLAVFMMQFLLQLKSALCSEYLKMRFGASAR